MYFRLYKQRSLHTLRQIKLQTEQLYSLKIQFLVNSSVFILSCLPKIEASITIKKNLKAPKKSHSTISNVTPSSRQIYILPQSLLFRHKRKARKTKEKRLSSCHLLLEVNSQLLVKAKQKMNSLFVYYACLQTENQCFSNLGLVTSLHQLQVSFSTFFLVLAHGMLIKTCCCISFLNLDRLFSFDYMHGRKGSILLC